MGPVVPCPPVLSSLCGKIAVYSQSQWGAPIFTIGGILGVTAGTFASIIESIGDYYACARLAGAPHPPGHALNRGIGMEGLGGFFSALWGTGTSSTSYSDNVGYIGITKVGSRLVIQVMAVTVLGGAFLIKTSAFFAAIPLPVVGGIFSVTIGMIATVGMSNLQYVDMNSPRNYFVRCWPLLFPRTCSSTAYAKESEPYQNRHE
nr:solute carrier family 23 member 1-like [Lytechinus pictus]